MMKPFVLCVTTATTLALGANARAQMAAPAPPPPPYGGDAAPRLGPIVLMRADNGRATLQVQTQLYWQDVCVTPCGVPVDPRGLYRVGGRPFTPSDTFSLPRQTGEVVIEAHMGSRAQHIVGTVMSLAGLGVGLTGGGFLLAASQEHNDQYGAVSPAKFFLTFYGVVFAIAGTVVALVGLPLYATSQTSAKVD